MMMIYSKKDMLFDFNKKCDLSDWLIVDDRVMGGVSQGQFMLNDDGHGVFKGDVSTANNGGFSSLRHRFESKEISSYKTVSIKLKGDGKKYQFRTKTSSRDWHSYITHFETSGEWETVDINLKDLYPSFRGRELDKPNYPGEIMEEIAFLISNKKDESFELIIDNITLK